MITLLSTQSCSADIVVVGPDNDSTGSPEHALRVQSASAPHRYLKNSRAKSFMVTLCCCSQFPPICPRFRA